MAEEEWLDAEAAARHLGLSTEFIYAMVNADQLPALRFPVRIRRHDLEGCLERCKIKPGDLAHLDAIGDRRGGNRNRSPVADTSSTCRRTRTLRRTHRCPAIGWVARHCRPTRDDQRSRVGEEVEAEFAGSTLLARLPQSA